MIRIGRMILHAYRPTHVGLVGGKWDRDVNGWCLSFGCRLIAFAIAWG